MNRALIIIPNNNILEIPTVYKDINDNEFHAMYIENFIREHNLGLTADNLGIEEGCYSGYDWQISLASIGHVNINHGPIIIAYLPQFMSNNQKEWFKENKSYLKRNKKNLAYMIVNENQEIVEAKDQSNSDGNILNELYRYVNNSISYEDKMERKSK